MKTCWYCQKENNQIADDFFGDFKCVFCGVENDCLNPSERVPITEDNKGIVETIMQNEKEKGEEEMAINYNDEKYQGKFVYLPKVGESAEFDIEELSEVKSDNPKFNFSEDVPVMVNGEQVIDDDGEPAFKRKDLGYHIEARLKNGKILSVTSISAFIQVFKKNSINDGDKIKVEHIEKGVWTVTKL